MKEMDKLIVRKKKSTNFILEHKFIFMLITSFMFLSGVNFYLVYNFMMILERL